MRASAAAAAASALLLLGSATAKCSLRADTDVVVYSATGAGGVGEFSDKWTRAFFSWWSAANADLSAVFITDPAELAGVEVGCVLTDAKKFPRLKLYVQPGGSADNQSTSLGPGGRDNILNFAASPNGHYMGTCAGFYYGAGTYWWAGSFFPVAWAPHFFPTVEGSIVEIAEYPSYAPTQLDDGRTVIYWGGPTIGYNSTGAAVPNGARVLASFTTPRTLPAAFQYEGTYVRALFNSPHPEAQAGVGLTCAPPLPAGCLTPAQQLQNWQWLAAEINKLLGQAWVVPTQL